MSTREATEYSITVFSFESSAGPGVVVVDVTEGWMLKISRFEETLNMTLSCPSAQGVPAYTLAWRRKVRRRLPVTLGPLHCERGQVAPAHDVRSEHVQAVENVQSAELDLVCGRRGIVVRCVQISVNMFLIA